MIFIPARVVMIISEDSYDNDGRPTCVDGRDNDDHNDIGTYGVNHEVYDTFFDDDTYGDIWLCVRVSCMMVTV